MGSACRTATNGRHAGCWTMHAPRRPCCPRPLCDHGPPGPALGERCPGCGCCVRIAVLGCRPSPARRGACRRSADASTHQEVFRRVGSNGPGPAPVQSWPAPAGTHRPSRAGPPTGAAPRRDGHRHFRQTGTPHCGWWQAVRRARKRYNRSVDVACHPARRGYGFRPWRGAGTARRLWAGRNCRSGNFVGRQGLGLEQPLWAVTPARHPSFRYGQGWTLHLSLTADRRQGPRVALILAQCRWPWRQIGSLPFGRLTSLYQRPSALTQT